MNKQKEITGKLFFCDCCGYPITKEQFARGEWHPFETQSKIVILKGHQRHWVTPKEK